MPVPMLAGAPQALTKAPSPLIAPLSGSKPFQLKGLLSDLASISRVWGQAMNANSSSMMPGAGRASFGAAAANAISMKWAALHDAAQILAQLAGEEHEKSTPSVRNFPAVIRDAGGWRYQAACKGIEDLAAMLEPGLAALLAVNARGADPAMAANALWREYREAKQALLDMAPPAGAMGPRRSA